MRHPRSVLSDYLECTTFIVLFLVLPFAFVSLFRAPEKGPTPQTVVPTAPPVAPPAQAQPSWGIDYPGEGPGVRRDFVITIHAGSEESLAEAVEAVSRGIQNAEARLLMPLISTLGGTDSPSPEGVPNRLPKESGVYWYFIGRDGILDWVPPLPVTKYRTLRLDYDRRKRDRSGDPLPSPQE